MAVMTPFRRASNSPRNLVPARSAPMSRAYTDTSRSTAGTSPRWTRSAKPSTSAVFPTPGSPDEHRVVLPTTAEDMDGALQLALPADQRIDPSGGRLLHQVDR
jgi:hypothetical protein